MRSLMELAGQPLHWSVQNDSAQLPDTANRNYVLYDPVEPVVQAQVIWERMVKFDVVLEAGEGTFQVHMNLFDPKRQSVVWKAGMPESTAGFQLSEEGIITAKGWITTAGGRQLAWAPSHSAGYEYVIFQPGGPRLITISAAFARGVGGNPGHMLIAPKEAADPDLAALCTLGFALANEQVMLLHRQANRH